jgi:hypothetical protein
MRAPKSRPSSYTIISPRQPGAPTAGRDYKIDCSVRPMPLLRCRSVCSAEPGSRSLDDAVFAGASRGRQPRRGRRHGAIRGDPRPRGVPQRPRRKAKR